MDPDKIIRVYGQDADPNKNWDGLIVLDTGTWSQLAEMGNWIKQQFVPTCVIDHHVTQDYIGNPLILDVSAEATGRLVYECFTYFGITPTAAAANQMFIASNANEILIKIRHVICKLFNRISLWIKCQ